MTSRSLGNLYQLANAMGRTRMLQLGMGEVVYKTLPMYRERIQQIVKQVRLATCSTPYPCLHGDF